MIIKKFKEYINENSSYDYGCVMLYFNFKEIKNIHSIIEKDDIYIEPYDQSYGLEDEPHCTLLYGLHKNVKLEEVKKIVNNFKFEECIIKNVSLFENDYDVLKFDVEGKNLKECNEKLKKLPHTSDYQYHPHLTIAYIKKGKGKKYINMLKDKKYKIDPLYIIYSYSNGKKEIIEII
jgi:2'-5' RNA ligase